MDFSLEPIKLPTVFSAVFKRAKEKWVVDTRANRHACCNWNLFESMDVIQRLPKVITAGGIVIASGIGTVRLKGNGNDLVLTDVLYMLSFPVNLFLGVILYNSGSRICGKTSTLRDRLNKIIYEIDISADGLFLKTGIGSPLVFYTNQRLWHWRFGHLGAQNVRKTASMTKGMDLEKDQLEEEQCYTCDMAKSVRTVSRKPQLRAIHAFDEIHTDVVGPINPISKNGHKWAVIYTDNATRTRWIETFKYKREAYTYTITFVLYVKTQYNAKIKMIRLDGGTKYGGDKLIQFLKDHGIRLEPTVLYTPEQNGVAERSNCTIFEKLRCILFDSKAPKDLWPEFLRGIIHIINQIATAALDSKTPYKALAKDIDRQLNPNLPPMSYKPSVKHIRVLGCRVTVHIQKGRRTISEKGEPRAEEGILVGFEGTKIYRVWIPGRRGITRTSTIKFTEEEPLEE